MARFIRVGEQFFDNAGDPLSGGKLGFYEAGAAIADINKKTTYSDILETVANVNPIVLDSAGRSPVDIFFSGTAKIQLTDSADVQLDLKDPVPGLQPVTDAFSDWSAFVTYPEYALVKGSDGRFYRSVTSGNLNNDPTSTTGSWVETFFAEFLYLTGTADSLEIGLPSYTAVGDIFRVNAYSTACQECVVYWKCTATNAALPVGATAGDVTGAAEGILYILNSGSDYYKLEIVGDVCADALGVTGDGSTDDTAALQAAMTYGSNNERKVLLGYGTIKITDTVWATPVGSTFKSATIEGKGGGFDSNLSPTVINAASITSKPAIAFQLGRGVHFEGFMLLGGNTNYQGVISDVGDLTYDYANWAGAGIRDSQYSPYCGICVDAGVGNTPPDSGYSGVTYRNQASGSAKISMEDVYIERFVVGFMHNCEASPAVQGDDVQIYNCRFRNNKVAFAVGQSQARNISIIGCDFAYFRNAIDCLNYGQQVGQNPMIYSCQFGNGFELFQTSPSANFMVQAIRCESVHRLGSHGSGAVSKRFPVEFIDCDINLLSNAVSNRAPILYHSPGPVYFRGGNINEDGTDANIAPYNFVCNPIKFENTIFQVPDVDFNVIDGEVNRATPVQFENVELFDGSNRALANPSGHIYTLPARVVGMPGHMHWQQDNPVIHKPANANNYINVSNATIYVWSDTELQFNLSDVGDILVGDILMWVIDPFAGWAAGSQVAALKVNDITAGVVTCDLLFDRSYYDETYAPSSIPNRYWEWAPGQALTGDTNSNNQITNVSPTTIVKEGDWIIGTDIPANTRVTNVSGSTLTISRNATGTTVGVDLYFGRMHTVDLTAAF